MLQSKNLRVWTYILLLFWVTLGIHIIVQLRSLYEQQVQTTLMASGGVPFNFFIDILVSNLSFAFGLALLCILMIFMPVKRMSPILQRVAHPKFRYLNLQSVLLTIFAVIVVAFVVLRWRFIADYDLYALIAVPFSLILHMWWFSKDKPEQLDTVSQNPYALSLAIVLIIFIWIFWRHILNIVGDGWQFLTPILFLIVVLIIAASIRTLSPEVFLKTLIQRTNRWLGLGKEIQIRILLLAHLILTLTCLLLPDSSGFTFQTWLVGSLFIGISALFMWIVDPIAARFRWLITSLTLIAVLAIAFLAYARPEAIYITVDSLLYSIVADRLRTGSGLTIGDPDTYVPLVPRLSETHEFVHTPPLYVILLSLSAIIAGGDLLSGARGMHLLFIGLLPALSGIYVYIITRRNIWLTLAFAASIVMSIDIFTVYTRMWTETPFILALIGTYLALGLYVQKQKASYLWAGAICTAIAFFSRWIGAPLVASGALFVLLATRGKFWYKLWRAFIYGLISALPTTLFVVYNIFRSTDNSGTGRTLGFSPINRSDWLEGASNVLEWLNPIMSVDSWVLAVLVLVLPPLFVLIHIFLSWKSTGKGGDGMIVLLPIFFIVTYSAFFIFSKLYLDNALRIYYRHLVHIQVSLYFVVAYLFYLVTTKGQSKAYLTYTLVFVWTISVAVPFIDQINVLRNARDGLSPELRQSEVVAAVGELPDDAVIYSNNWFTEAIYFYEDTVSVRLAWFLSMENPIPSAEAIREVIESRDPVFFVLNEDDVSERVLNSIRTFADVVVYGRYSDGIIYRAYSQ